MVVTKADSTGLLTIQTVHGKDKSKLEIDGVDCLLWAIGRVPNSSDVGMGDLVSITS